jgi:phosphatidylglycerol:prolipoprotein diacylglycerol transferase
VVPIGLFFGRIANFVNGELWGRTAPDFPYAIVFPNGGPGRRKPTRRTASAIRTNSTRPSATAS